LILLHDNARPHVAKPVKKYLEGVKWEILPHPPYSPDIASSDFHLFRSMQSALLENDSILMKVSKNDLMNGSLQKNQIFSFEKSVYYRKSGRKLSLPKEHTLNKLTYIDLFK
ncbi:Histone-lysine N-methyltransferase SETMAR, partial [Acromyrmex echinatior]